MKTAAMLKPNWDDKQETQKMMDERLLIELKDLITRLRKIIEREEPVKIRPIFEVRPEDEGLLERSEND